MTFEPIDPVRKYGQTLTGQPAPAGGYDRRDQTSVARVSPTSAWGRSIGAIAGDGPHRVRRRGHLRGRL
jgi:hypothetical protein